MTLLNGKNIIVFGAAGLLGAELVRGIVKASGRVIAVDISSDAIEKKFSDEWLKINSNKFTIKELDVNNESSVVDYFAKSKKIDGAVNASYPKNITYGAHFFDVTLESFNENLNLHLGSSFLLMRECAKYQRRMDEGFSFVNIASIYGVMAPDFSIYEGTSMTMPVEYAAIKSGIIHLNRYVSSYVKNTEFRVNSISPGGIENGQPTEFLEQYRKKTHGAGMLQPSDICGSIIFLLSELSNFITGQNIIVDDGWHL